MHRRSLVRTQVEFLEEKAENFFNYSSYDGTYWVVDDADDADSISFGTRADHARTTLTDYTTVGYMNCVQTWEGDGTFRSTTRSPTAAYETVLTFSAHVGANEMNTSPEMTVVMGVTNSDGSVKQAIRTWTINTMTRVWFSEVAGVLADYGLGSDEEQYFYIQITNDGKWWIDELQLEGNTTYGKPERFVRVSGTYVQNNTDRTLLTSRKVCPDCLESILSKSNKFGWTEESPTDEPVETLEQDI
jgi:hypothetical protein